MPPKRKACVTDDEEQRLLRQFYDNLDDDTFLGNSAKTVSKPLEAFSLFTPDRLLENTVHHTNQNIEIFFRLFQFFRDDSYVLVNMTDIKSYLGLMYTCVYIETKFIQFLPYLVP